MRSAFGLLAVLAVAAPAHATVPTDIDVWSGRFSAVCGPDAEVCPAIPRGHSSDDLVIAGLTLRVVDEPLDDRFPDQGNVRVRFTPGHAYCSHVSINFTGTKDGAGDWRGTFSPPAGSWWNAPAHRTQTITMFLDEGVWRIGVSAFATPGCPQGTPRAAYDFKLELAWVSRAQPGTTLEIAGERTGDMSTRSGVRYAGKGWKRDGGPIVVRWGREVVKRFGAARRFSGTLDLDRFPTQTPTSCAGTLTATQGGLTRTLDLKGRPERYYYAAEKLTYGDGKALRAGAILCRGREPRAPKGHVAVYRPLRGENPALVIDDAPGGVHVEGVWFESMASRIDLGVGAGRRLTIAPRADIGPFLPDVAGREPTNATTEIDTAGPITEPDPVRLNNGTTLAKQSIAFAVNLITGDASSLFAIHGDLRVDKSTTGHGGLVALGDIVLRGPVRLTEALVEAARTLRLG